MKGDSDDLRRGGTAVAWQRACTRWRTLWATQRSTFKVEQANPDYHTNKIRSMWVMSPWSQHGGAYSRFAQLFPANPPVDQRGEKSSNRGRRGISDYTEQQGPAVVYHVVRGGKMATSFRPQRSAIFSAGAPGDPHDDPSHGRKTCSGVNGRVFSGSQGTRLALLLLSEPSARRVPAGAERIADRTRVLRFPASMIVLFTDLLAGAPITGSDEKGRCCIRWRRGIITPSTSSPMGAGRAIPKASGLSARGLCQWFCGRGRRSLAWFFFFRPRGRRGPPRSFSRDDGRLVSRARGNGLSELIRSAAPQTPRARAGGDIT